MARGKRSTSEGVESSDTAVLAGDAEQKAKTGGAKVTLVKPAQEDNSSESENAGEATVEAKTAPRPKVGRSGTARKKKTETPEQKAAKAEKKESKAKAALEIKNEETVAVLPEPTQETVMAETSVSPELVVVETVPLAALHEPLSETLHADETSIEESELADVPADWDTSNRTRPDIKFTLFLLALFAAVNIGLVFLLNGSHKAKPAPVPQVTGQVARPSQAALPATPAQLNDTAAAPIAPVPVDSAPALISAVKPTDLPPIPAAPAAPEMQVPSVPKNAAPVTPVAVSPATQEAAAPQEAPPAPVVAAAPEKPAAPATSAVKENDNKVQNQQELLSILNKN